MTSKRILPLFMAAMITLLGAMRVQADSVLLTLDLTNNNIDDAASGGSWRLSARKVETATAPQGDHGIAAIRAILNTVSIGSIVFAGDINQLPGGPYTQTLSNGAIEVLYAQDTSAPGVVTGVGVSANPNLDRLIASGIWPAGAARPTFGMDDSLPTPFFSQAQFLNNPSPPYGASAAIAATSVVTVGDLDNSNTVTLADYQLFLDQFPPTSAPYHPAADLNQSGTVNGADNFLFRELLSIPEPASLLLVGMGAICALSWRRLV